MGIVPKIRRFFIGEKPSSPTEARLLRKIDTVLLAYLCLSQFMNFLDRQNITNAYVSGMAEDVGFKGLDYNITQTIFQVGYIVGGIPQSLIVSSNRIRLSIWLPLCCMGWGMTNLGVAFSTQVYQIQICRFFMALFESVSFAGGHYVLGIWYKPSELGKRAALLTASQNTGGLFAGVMQGAIYSTLNGRLGMAGWRWMILVNTLMTVPVALFGFFTFPDTPQDCRRAWLSKEELQVAIDRVPERVQTKLSWKTFKRIFLEWRFWAFTFQFSFNTIMEWSGLFAPMQLWMRWTGWYTVPQINYYPLGTTAIIITSTFFFALWSDYTQSRWWVNCVMATFSGVAAVILLVWEIPTAAKYFAWYLAGMGYIGQATNFAWANEMCRDNDQLRAYTLYAMVYGSNVSIAVFGIAFFPVTDLPRFTKGYAGSLAICILSPPLAYAIHRACKSRAVRLKMEAEAAGTIEYRPADSPAAEAQYEDVDEKKGELVIPEEGDVKVSEVPVSMVR